MLELSIVTQRIFFDNDEKFVIPNLKKNPTSFLPSKIFLKKAIISKDFQRHGKLLN